ncbi:hypothetical protein QUA27_13030 [Microcoleus sp. Pol14C6]|uniref:hypothetical protein n=1 Tax=unclassified Microcoleus TaxID=2642155 RepID=UPI002FD60FFB
MESNNRFLQEVPSESSAITAAAPENSTSGELNDSELDAIAGGMRTITVSGEKPNFGRGPSMSLIEAMQSYFGK